MAKAESMALAQNRSAAKPLSGNRSEETTGERKRLAKMAEESIGPEGGNENLKAAGSADGWQLWRRKRNIRRLISNDSQLSAIEENETMAKAGQPMSAAYPGVMAVVNIWLWRKYSGET
jgi:hypothetical protein